jgi:hypothetical protein
MEGARHFLTDYQFHEHLAPLLSPPPDADIQKISVFIEASMKNFLVWQVTHYDLKIKKAGPRLTLPYEAPCAGLIVNSRA